MNFKQLALSVSCLFMLSCEKENPIIPNEEELITTLSYTLSPSNGGTPVVLLFKDLDGDGGIPPTVTGGLLESNTIYNGVLDLLNESDSPAESITDEVNEEGDEHQFFFAKSSGLDAAIQYVDLDVNGDPLGLKTDFVTGGTSSGTITITLRHEPNKSAAGVANGDIANAGGETDIEVTFNVEIQ